MREFDRGTRGWFLRKVVLGHGGVKQRILSYHMTPVTQVIGHRQQHCSAALQHCMVACACHHVSFFRVCTPVHAALCSMDVCICSQSALVVGQDT
jgi:hypothetical protein